MIHVLYHGNCYDGFGAAYAVWKKFGNSAKYIPVSYGQPLPDLSKATEVIIVDFCYPPEILLGIAENNKLTVLDHHKTAEAALKDFKHINATVVFDMSKSGALIAWEFFHRDYSNRPPNDSVAHEAPLLIQHISDRDLWTFKIDGTSKVHKALVSYPMDFELWDSFDVEKLKLEGAACERLYSNLVSNICEKSWVANIGGHDVPVVNTSIAWSEVGQELIDKNPNAKFVGSFTIMKNSIMWSLRSKGEFDVSEVAKLYGGGGHKNASGFKTTKIVHDSLMVAMPAEIKP